MPAISRSERYRRIVTVMLDEGFGTLVDQLGMRAPWISSLRGDRAKGADANLTPEQRLRRTMERLGPTFAKIGQMLSVRPDLIPASFAEELARLQDTMEPFPFEQVQARDRDARSAQPLEELFAEFDEVPAAAASIGQVHMAVLLDGTPVAVKVQRPGIHEVIEADLDILRTQARRVQGRTDLGRKYDLVGLVDEFSRAIHEECDYINEAENCERLGATFADDPDVHFPPVYWERTTSTVLTLERIVGIPFNRLDELDRQHVDRQAAARKGIVCYYEQIFMHGFFHADPHPGNLFALPDGRVAFTDFGRCGKLSEHARTPGRRPARRDHRAGRPARDRHPARGERRLGRHRHPRAAARRDDAHRQVLRHGAARGRQQDAHRRGDVAHRQARADDVVASSRCCSRRSPRCRRSARRSTRASTSSTRSALRAPPRRGADEARGDLPGLRLDDAPSRARAAEPARTASRERSGASATATCA